MDRTAHDFSSCWSTCRCLGLLREGDGFVLPRASNVLLQSKSVVCQIVSPCFTILRHPPHPRHSPTLTKFHRSPDRKCFRGSIASPATRLWRPVETQRSFSTGTCAGLRGGEGMRVWSGLVASLRTSNNSSYIGKYVFYMYSIESGSMFSINQSDPKTYMNLLV